MRARIIKYQTACLQKEEELEVKSISISIYCTCGLGVPALKRVGDA